jgi:hypothetical protein
MDHFVGLDVSVKETSVRVTTPNSEQSFYLNIQHSRSSCGRTDRNAATNGVQRAPKTAKQNLSSLSALVS